VRYKYFINENRVHSFRVTARRFRRRFVRTNSVTPKNPRYSFEGFAEDPRRLIRNGIFGPSRQLHVAFTTSDTITDEYTAVYIAVHISRVYFRQLLLEKVIRRTDVFTRASLVH